MNLKCYRVDANAAALIPARSERAWMNDTHNRFAYRCTPLTMANATGWELLCPVGLTAVWNGGSGLADLQVTKDDGLAPGNVFAESHFGNGVITFHPGYLFRTDPEWAVLCRGAPNSPKDGVMPLEGLVETDWLPFTFTMNWKMTRPGTVRFEKGECFCFITPVQHLALEQIQPKIMPISANPDLQAEYAAWKASRHDFNKRLAGKEPAAVKEKWQRYYLKGIPPEGAPAPESHRIERKLAEPAAEPAVAHRAPTASAASRQPAESTPVFQNIVWIASYPKSGNTWVRAFIHNLLLEVQGNGERVQDINRMHEHTAWDIPAGPFEKVLGKKIAEASHADVARARPEVQKRLADSRKRPFFAKTHLSVTLDHGYPTIDLNGTLAAIYVVRNPLDIALSYSHHSGHNLDWTIAQMGELGFKTLMTQQNVYELVGSWSQNVGSWMGVFQRPVHAMRYEDLLNEPLRHFGALARFLRLAPSEAQLASAIAKSSFSELSRQERDNGFNEKPATSERFFREGRAGQWREVLSPAQVQTIVKTHAPLMQRFGYLPPACGTKDEAVFFESSRSSVCVNDVPSALQVG